MAEKRVEIHLDLYAWSHTGYGGEIFISSGTTDKSGNYRIEQVYPNKFYIDLTDMIWMKTRVRGDRWVADRFDELTPGIREKVLHVDMVAAPEPPYRYFGKVTDEQGDPVPNAKVTLGVSLHCPPRTWNDEHNYVSVVTDGSGAYSLRVESRFVRGFSVEAPGFAHSDRWADDGDGYKPFLPGTYDFKLKK
jgi:hypothetical protein